MAGLPEGLVTTSETITGEIESVDHVDVADIIKLWKGIVPTGHRGRTRTKATFDSILYEPETSCGWRGPTTGEFLLEIMEQRSYIEEYHWLSSGCPLRRHIRGRTSSHNPNPVSSSLEGSRRLQHWAHTPTALSATNQQGWRPEQSQSCEPNSR